ncbi:MAG TPA: class I SAM-dependent methyltransferase, partial [Thermoanaerobaculia bacterium]|nr:class I SAM-dependent methyltransferase [Thermoanaerobaculia bacterium]
MEPTIQNLMYATGDQPVDEMNAEFYGQIRYPWPPQYFERVKRGDLGGRMLAQDIGHWGASILPKDARIWVAGCGTNQALFTALRFPDAVVLGSDLSLESLALCAENAARLGISNLELRRESINQVEYEGCFDYVICTGVIHHNADPIAPLSRLAKALKPEGLLELMVYNQYHRILSSAFQNAVRALLGNPSRPDLALELLVARRLIASLQGDHLMPCFLKEFAAAPDAAFADTLLQPVEHSFTIRSLAQAADRCHLEM